MAIGHSQLLTFSPRENDQWWPGRGEEGGRFLPAPWGGRSGPRGVDMMAEIMADYIVSARSSGVEGWRLGIHLCRDDTRAFLLAFSARAL